MKNDNLLNGYVIALLRYSSVSLIESRTSESRHLNNKRYANSFGLQSFSPRTNLSLAGSENTPCPFSNGTAVARLSEHSVTRWIYR